VQGGGCHECVKMLYGRERGQASQNLVMGAHIQGKWEGPNLKRRATSLEEKAMLIQCAGGQAVELVTQRDVGSTETLSGPGLGQPAGADLA